MSSVPEMLSVVIPAYNEEARIAPTVRHVLGYLEARFPRHEVIVVDDGSADATAAVAAEAAAGRANFRVLRRETNMGKGAAVRRGVLEARGDAILFMDADLSMPIEEVEKLLAALGDGADLAIASRRLAGAELRKRPSRPREALGHAFTFLVRAFTGVGVTDSQCGFKLFRREAARDLFTRQTIDGFAFDVELLMLARGRWRVREVPITCTHAPGSRVSLTRDAPRMLLDVARLALRRTRAPAAPPR